MGERRDEDDRDVRGALAPLDQLCELVAVEVGHLDVEQDACEVVEEQLLERSGAGRHGDEPVSERLEDGLEREEVLLVVVDQQDARRAAHAPTSTHSP